ncbi:hypothetical protein Y032_0068g233 [Ancylostoma ceylanicum]|uniref:Uncharacterized protein n=1 Tax=Ancylostoma ceylanicum TaxID=53326 RepID=A0A016TYX3_9BILA|nr:hypothetical protein Y032_0068g233 [Ancylostoma ceylanicum]
MRKGFPDPSALRLDETTLENTDEYIYLWRLINMNYLKPKIIRRRRAAWAAYNTNEPAVPEITNRKMRDKLFNSTVVPALRCGIETWMLTESMEARLKTMRVPKEIWSATH